MRKLLIFLLCQKVFEKTATNEGIHIEFETPSSQKMLLLKRRESFPDLCHSLSLNYTIYIGTNI
jgi:hypothetical protein